MTHEEIKNALGAYSLGALDDDDRVLLEEHLQGGCSECEATLKEMQVVVTDMAFAVDAQAPPAHLKAKIFAAIAPGAVTVPADPKRAVYEKALVTLLEKGRARWMRVSWALSFAVVAILMAAGWYTRSLQNQIDVLDSQVQINSGMVEQLRTELADKERIINVVQSPEIRIVDLQGQPVSPSAKGKVFWNPVQNKAVLYAFDLPQAPAGKDYQLWMIRGDTPVDAGVFNIDADGFSVHELDTISDAENLAAFAVTLEPKGGVPQPTGEMYLLGAGE